MACASCSTSGGSAPGGCQNKGACGTDSCNKLSVFDWLSNMTLPGGQELFTTVEVRFKNGRKEFYRNPDSLSLSIGDVVATEASPGHDIGIVSLTGELVRVQMKKKSVNPFAPDLLKVYRKASQKDLDIWASVREREEVMKVRAREIAIYLKLEMKISDIEFQGDGSKATFYYTAETRIDFRQLIKEFAREFSVRIEMKQVGFRQEAARLGGIGSCGRELCCSTWLTDFRSVNTSAARYQQLSLNPQKLAGQCGKLKCCLNYELDTYMDALRDFPDPETKLYTEKGDAVCQKQDIFKGLMWFAYTDNFANWHVLKTEQVREIIAENKLKNKVSSLEDYAEEIPAKLPEQEFNNPVGQESLTRFDQPKRKKRPNKNKKQGAAAQEPPRESRAPRSDNRQSRPNPNQGQNRGSRPEGKGGGQSRPEGTRNNEQTRTNPDSAPNLNSGGQTRPNSQGNVQPNANRGGQPRQDREGGANTKSNANGNRQPRPNREGNPNANANHGGSQHRPEGQNRENNQKKPFSKDEPLKE